MAAKKRKYQDDYLQFGFVSICIGTVEKPQCVICQKVLSADCMRPNKLKAHLENVHPTYQGKDNSFFHGLERTVKGARLDNTGLFQIQNQYALTASYEVSQLIARTKKPHTIGESLIAPCVEIIVRRMLGENKLSKVKQVSLSNTSIKRRIVNLDEDIEEQVVAGIRSSPVFSIQLDESTDVASLSQLIAFVRYIENGTMKTEFLFCKPLKTTCKAEDIYDIIANYFEVHKIDRKYLVSCTTDGAPAMMGKKAGVIQRLKSVSSQLIGNHCCLHRKVLSSKSMPGEFATTFNYIVQEINAIKSSATNSRLFTELCEVQEADFENLLFFTAVRWLSRGKAVQRVFELRAVIAEFLHSKNHLLAEYFLDKHFLAKVAYLADMFSALCTVNTSLQGRDIVMFEACDKLGTFSDRLKLWKRRVQRGQLEHFHNLKIFLDTESIECTFQSEIIEHIDILLGYLEQYFEDDIVMYKSKQWVKFPFDQSTLDLISDNDFNIKDEFISLRADSTLKIEYTQVSVDRFWIRRLDSFPLLAHDAVKVLMMFPTYWECEAAFSQISIIKTKHRNRLDVEPDIRVALSSTSPRIGHIIESKHKQIHMPK